MGGVVAVGGKRLEMSCPVAGYPIESVVWEKDGRRLNGRQKVQLLNSSLAIDPVDKASDAGVYSCEARQHGGLSARQSFQLNVIGKSVSSFLFFLPGKCQRKLRNRRAAFDADGRRRFERRGAAGPAMRRRQRRTAPVRLLVQRRAGHPAQHQHQLFLKRPAD